jgi:uncharacterized protein (DUF1330 family)
VARGYVIARIVVTDPEAYSEYRAGVLETVERYDGRFLVRGGGFDVLEGEWPDERVVVIEFPSIDEARAWYDSDEYQPLARMRQSASPGNIILVERAGS